MLLATGTAGAHTFMDRAPWFWQDLFKVYLPKAFSKMRDFPIPRYAVTSTIAWIATD